MSNVTIAYTMKSQCLLQLSVSIQPITEYYTEVYIFEWNDIEYRSYILLQVLYI